MAAQKPVFVDSNNDLSVFLTGDFVALTNGGTGATDAATARTNLGLAIGTNVQAWDADLDAVAALSGTGIAVRTGAGTWANRSLTAPANGISITNPDGVSGSPTFALTNDLAALEGLSSTGVAVRIGSDSWAQRTIAGTASNIVVTNGDGVAGNPTVNLASVTDTGTGNFRKFNIDGFGRVTGTTNVVAADITALVDATYINVSGDTMTGFLTLNADPSTALHAATKQYVDALAAGQRDKQAVRAIAIANVNISNPGTAVFDGVTLATSDRLLLTGQSTASENGAYVFNTSGTALVRAADYDASVEVKGGDTFFVNEGTTYADTNWTLITNGTIALGTTGLTFTQTSGLGQIIAGNGITKTGNQLDVGTASATRIVVNADNIDLATVAGLTPGTYTKVTVDAYGRTTLGATATPSDIGAQAADTDLDALAGLATTGIIVRTGAGTATTRSLTAPAAGITIGNADGVAGSPTFGLANDLGALEALASTGYAVRTGTDTWEQRTITGNAGRTVITNGDGTAGNTNVDLASGVATPGTYNSVTVDTYGRVTAGSSTSSTSEGTTSTLTNNQGATIVIGRAVYSDGSGTVRLANSAAVGTRKPTGLVADASIGSAASGTIVTAGVLTATTTQWDVVTGQTGGLTTDSYYYLSGTTDGALTTTAPTTGWMVRVGKALSTTKMRLQMDSPIRLT